MAKQTINVGSNANSKDGDIIRDAFNKTNQNFDEIYLALTDGVNFAQVKADWTANSGVAQILNKPTIPTNTNQLTNGAGFITSTNQLVNGDYTVSLGADGTLIAPSAIAFGDGNRTNINQVNNNFVIATNTGPGEYNWTFDDLGNLTLPGGAVIDTNYDGAGGTTSFWGAPGQYIDIRGKIADNIFGGGMIIHPDGKVDILAQNSEASANWSFNVNSGLTFPNLTTQTTAWTGSVSSLVNGSKTVSLGSTGTLTVPSPTSPVFTLTFAESNYVPTISKPTLTLTDTPWELHGQYAYTTDGRVAPLALDNIFPVLVNPGYTSGDSFTFDESIHGVAGYTLTVTLTDVVLPGGAGWTANIEMNDPPEYPSTVKSLGAIKLTSNDNSWVFGTDGSLTLPQGGDVLDSEGNSVLSGGDLRSNALVNTTETFTLSETGNVTFSGETGGINRGIVWDYGAAAGGSNSRIRQDEDGLTVRAWTEENLAGFYSAPVRILTNQGDNERIWQFDGSGDLTLPQGGDILDSNGNSVLGGEGLGTITVPAVTAGTYKGLQVSYGMIHSNRDWDELNVNKIVIHKPVNPTVTIDPIANSDDFEVNGLGASDVLAMFVVYGDANGPKPLSELQAFAEAIIDNVILTNGEAGVYNTVDQMKTAFYASGQQLTSAVGGLYTDFEFFTYNTSFPVTGGGTLVEGSGATFNISDDGIGTYSVLGFASAPGNNYLPGHKIKILGTDLGGLTPDNDAIITITSIDGDGIITGASVTGTAAGASSVLYESVTGTNYQVGTGFSVSSLTYNIDTDTVGLGEWNGGSGYVTGDVIEILGTNILGSGGTPLVSPDNDITVTLVTDGFGIENFTVAGTLPTPVPAWPTNNISDGGADQYDTANYINTNLAEDIAYNGGETVVDGTTSFGTGSSYSFVYSTAIFGLFVTGNSATSLSTSGESGGDSSSTTEAGFIYDAALPEQTVDNAVNHINIVAPQNPYAGALVSFTHTDNGNEVDILIADDGLGAGVGITRNSNQGIYNPYRDDGWTSSVSPSGTLWNIDGWADFGDVESRTYTNLLAAFGGGGLGNNIVDTECVMYLPDNGKYYAVKFTQWTQNAGGGGFAYTRQEIDLDNIQYGIRFDDGTRLTSAEGIGRVKLRAPGNRRIEEVHGYKSVAVTQKVINLYTSTAYESNSGNTNQIRINAVGTALADLIALSGYYDIQVSLDQTNWVTGYIYGTSDNYVEVAFNNQARLPVVDINDTVYYRTRVGGEPVQWWSKSELPGGSTNFRGAVIDYHAYTTSGTVIGTIHIVDDDGEEHVTHTEVVSGSSDAEFIDLWFVTNEGSINFRRTDGIGSTLRVQWTAKVFYGSQTYD